MSDIPIIFSAPMVRALLDGRKTMTRRMAWSYPDPKKNPQGARLLAELRAQGLGDAERRRQLRPSPWQRVKPGDRLWVRESLTRSGGLIQRVADGWSAALWPPDWKQDPRPSIHMPRWASRLTLIVTATKIELLQDISEADAKAEGAMPRHYTTKRGQRCYGWNMDWPEADADCEGTALTTARYAFGNFICCLHDGKNWNLKPTPCIWDRNPEVVALSFTVHKQNIDTLPKSEAA